jgi:hypothetical protein
VEGSHGVEGLHDHEVERALEKIEFRVAQEVSCVMTT